MLRSKKGFTLFELILVIAISAIVLASVANVLPYIHKVNSKAYDLSHVQSLAQITMSKIENKLRYAARVNIEVNLPQGLQDDFTYIYLSEGKIEEKTSGTYNTIAPEKGFEDYDYTVAFSAVNTKVLDINLSIKKGGQKIYTISSKISILNLGSASITGVTQGSCVSFKLLPKAPILVSSIIVKSSADSINGEGQTLQMNAEVYPENAANKGVAWSVDNTEYASITPEGLLRPLKNGVVTVTATSIDGSNIIGSKQIIISNLYVKITSLHLTTSTGGTILERYGNTMTIIPHITPENATNTQITWRVDNTSYATIDESGVLKSGNYKNVSVVVTASTNDGSNKTATIEIRIK